MLIIVLIDFTLSVHDIEVWIIFPPRPESQGNIHIHDT
jgi:hypothetical protein